MLLLGPKAILQTSAYKDDGRECANGCLSVGSGGEGGEGEGAEEIPY